MPHNQVREVWCDSKVTGSWRHALVHLPPGYDERTYDIARDASRVLSRVNREAMAPA